MKHTYNKSQIIRPLLRAFVLVGLFVGPFAVFAASAAEQGGNSKGVGFVLYMALSR